MASLLGVCFRLIGAFVCQKAGKTLSDWGIFVFCLDGMSVVSLR